MFATNFDRSQKINYELGTFPGVFPYHKSIYITFRVVLSDDCKFFATASDDSTVKIWDTNRLDGKALTTRSKYNYTKQGIFFSTIYGDLQ